MLLLPNVNLVYAAPFSTNVATDVYGVAQGGAVNGVPTANQDNDGVPDINDAINLLTGGTVANNVGYDDRFFGTDEFWQEMGSGAVALIGLTAGHQNTVGVYTDLGTGAVQTVVLATAPGTGFTGDGTIGNPFPGGMTGLALNQNFGWFLDSTPVGGSTTTYFSEAALNPNSFDHMMTFDLSDLSGNMIFVDFGGIIGIQPIVLGSDTFLIAWEDLPFNGQTLGDDDYDDMMYLVTSVDPIGVGGEIIPIESTSLILAGAQTFSWMIPVVLSVLGIGMFIVSRKSE